MLVGLRRAKELKIERLRVRLDCLSVVRHLSGEEELGTYWAARFKEETRELLSSFALIEARWTPSSHALERQAGVPTADILARRAVGLGPRKAPRRGRGGSG